MSLGQQRRRSFFGSDDTRQHDCFEKKKGKENIAPGRGHAGLPLRLNLNLIFIVIYPSTPAAKMSPSQS